MEFKAAITIAGKSPPSPPERSQPLPATVAPPPPSATMPSAGSRPTQPAADTADPEPTVSSPDHKTGSRRHRHQLQQQQHAAHTTPSQSAEYHQMRTATAGAVAAAVARVFVQPLDVLKIRFQLQVEPLNHKHAVSSKYTSMWQAMRTISYEEGVRAFWKGHTPAQGLSVVYGVAQFWTYERLKAQAKHWNVYAAHRDSTNFVCGAMAGGLGTVVITPLDVIRTRLIAQDNRRGYANTWHAGRTIVRAEGVRGLYRGLGPGMLQVGPLTGINFMAYNKLCGWSVDWLGLETKGDLPAVVSLMNGAVAGLLAKAIVYPLDLAKKRLQIQGFGEHRHNYGQHFQCRNAWHCFKSTVRTEGMTGLYKGMMPSIWKSGVTSAINFCIYDNIVAAVIRADERHFEAK